MALLKYGPTLKKLCFAYFIQTNPFLNVCGRWFFVFQSFSCFHGSYSNTSNLDYRTNRHFPHCLLLLIKRFIVIAPQFFWSVFGWLEYQVQPVAPNRVLSCLVNSRTIFNLQHTSPKEVLSMAEYNPSQKRLIYFSIWVFKRLK